MGPLQQRMLLIRHNGGWFSPLMERKRKSAGQNDKDFNKMLILKNRSQDIIWLKLMICKDKEFFQQPLKKSQGQKN